MTLETSLPGVFAVGDVRSGSVKRVASAVGEGAMSIHFVHRHLGRTAAHQQHRQLTAHPSEGVRLARMTPRRCGI